MKVAPEPVALCSSCGTTLAAGGECLPCLVRVGFDAPDEDGRGAGSFGDYELARREDGSLCELGRGAMGVTYRAHDTVLNRSVALKVIDAPASSVNGHAVRDRFLREARAAAALHHPNVASVFQFGTTAAGDRCFYAMELVEGETLEALVRREGPMKVDAALEVAVQVTHALMAAATHGLVHRDLKPGNIMLARSDAADSSMTVKVIDFGLAKAVAANAAEMDLTQGGFVGTPAFASPEQFSGARSDARSDIYSLGVTLWYALTGEVPYGGRTAEEIRAAQAGLSLPVANLAARQVPAAVIQLLRRVLAVDPAQRPQSPRELLAGLEQCRAPVRRTRSLTPARMALAAALLISAAASVAYWSAKPNVTPPTVAPPKSIAVLPFVNMSDDKANAYFADGVQEEILTTLAKVADLKVISRTSVMQFRETEKRNLRDIAQQLGVAHVLEGSVQRAGNRVRVTAQLIDTRTDSHVWADRYDGELADVFGMQTEIAQKIAAQLQAALSPNERLALRAKPTADAEAYDLYLRAREIYRAEAGAGQALRGALERQITLLEEATARDPAFVPALCTLAQAHLRMHWFNYDHTPARVELANKALEVAARLQPDAGEVHLARAVVRYGVSRDFAAAIGDLAVAARKLPNNAEVLYFTGVVLRRQGRWAEAARTTERALQVDPRNATVASELANLYGALKQYDDARRWRDAILRWKPEDLGFQAMRAELDIAERADLRRLEKLVSEMPATTDQDQQAALRWRLARLKRDHRAAEEALAQTRASEFASGGYIVPREFREGLIARALGDLARAQAAFSRANERVVAMVAARPNDHKALMVLARTYAQLGRKEEAVAAAERACEMVPVARDAVDGTGLLTGMIATYADVGEIDRAFHVLEQAAQLPGGTNYGFLRLAPEFDPLRHDPRFDRIVASLAPKSGAE